MADLEKGKRPVGIYSLFHQSLGIKVNVVMTTGGKVRNFCYRHVYDRKCKVVGFELKHLVAVQQIITMLPQNTSI